MIIDKHLEIADNTAVPLTGTLTNPLVIGESLDLHPLVADNPTVDFSAGEPIYLVIEVTTAFTGTLTWYQFKTYTHTAALAAGEIASAGTQLSSTGAIFIADLAVGRRFICTMPEGEYERYYMLSGNANDSGAGVLTTGSVSAYLTKNVNNWVSTNTRTG